MTNLKHYHLGCGESLQSNRTELQKMIATRYTAEAKPKQKPGISLNKRKQH
jgi:hypothetical protein